MVAIKMMDRGGGNEENLITFPITPTKIIGYIDNTDSDAYEIDYDSWTAELKKDIIAPKDLMDYCKNNAGDYKQYTFDTIIEYDPNIDRSRQREDDYHTAPFVDGGICGIMISYNLNGEQEYNVNSAQFYCNFVKVTIDNKDYLLVYPAGD